MSQRISDQTIQAFFDYYRSGIGTHAPFTVLERDMFLDLRDARAEIARMKALSESQAQALDQMEAGKL